jgi:hypothetical protein
VLPFLTAVVAAAFAAVVFVRYVRSRRGALLAWAIGLAMFAVAALAGALARSGAPTESEYRTFYLFGAILNVAWLGLGTAWLLLRSRTWRTFSLALVALLTVVAAYTVFTTSVDLSVAMATGRGFPDGSAPRILAGIGSGVGSVVLVGGAIWSAWVFYRRRHSGRRAISNVVIAIGVLIVAFGGTVTLTGANGVLEVTNLIGIAVMFVGFLLA